ncbi:glycoside hydrolase family 97 protein, partial [Bacteroidales bacterium OttesenSCG-928-A17]|nr:glycoside hydrolase family 97 protein [Bacteroidales bacterium OttesenSCG-928-A17]
NIILLLCFTFGMQAQEISSPNGNVSARFTVRAGVPYYDILYKGQDVIKSGRLGMELFTNEFQKKGIKISENTYSLDNNFEIVEVKNSTFDETWEPVWGENKTIRNHYNEMAITLNQTTAERNIIIRFRVYDDGVGFRYEFPQQANLNFFNIKNELTTFPLTGDHKAFWLPGDYNTEEYQSTTSKLSEIRGIQTQKRLDVGENHNLFNNYGILAVQSPLMMKSGNGLYINIHEAALINYSAMQLELDDKNFILSTHLAPDAMGTRGFMQADCQTPWRTIIVSDDARDILASNLILNLNDPCKYEDTSWIKPVKYIGVWWEMFVNGSTWWYTDETRNTKLGKTDYTKLKPNGTHGATNENVRRYIDFAAEHGFDQVLVEGWNVGWEDWTGNGKEEVFDFVTPYPDFDVKALQKYAMDKGVRVMMHNETSASATEYERRLDAAYQFMEDNHYTAVKTGYVGYPIPRGEWRSGQWMNNHYVRVIEKAAEHKVCLNSHEATRPTGLCRTYPNWLAQESARGTEFESMGGNNPNHTCILPFTRLVGGPMDYTPGIFQIKFDYYNPENSNRVHTTLAKQLALYVTMYSPLQMAADLPQNYERFLDAFQFIKDVAIDWDQSWYLEAEPGEYITVARKAKGENEWFVGAITNENPREAIIDFGFLPAKQKFTATIYEDAKDTNWDSNPMTYKIRTIKVDSKTKLKQKLASGGGCAISIK